MAKIIRRVTVCNEQKNAWRSNAPRLESSPVELPPQKRTPLIPRAIERDTPDDLITAYMGSEEVKNDIGYYIENNVPIKDYLSSSSYRLLELEEPYIEALPLLLVVEAFRLTWARESLFYELYRQLNIYRTKDANSEGLIPVHEKESIISAIQQHSQTAISQHGQVSVMDALGHDNCDVRIQLSRILKAHVKKADLYLFMAAAGVQQVQGVPGYPLGFTPEGEDTNPPATEQVTAGNAEKERIQLIVEGLLSRCKDKTVNKVKPRGGKNKPTEYEILLVGKHSLEGTGYGNATDIILGDDHSYGGTKWAITRRRHFLKLMDALGYDCRPHMPQKQKKAP